MTDDATKLLTKSAQYREYSRAVNPLGQGTIPPVVSAELPSSLHMTGDTRVIPFDLSKQLDCSYPATGPSLLANFIRIKSGESIDTKVNATSELYYVIRGAGTSGVGSDQIAWSQGDFFIIPGGRPCVHKAEADTAFYWVHDQPLLRYLGATVSEARFEPTLYTADVCKRELDKIAKDPASAQRNRISVLLGNAAFPQTMTVTHTLWAMFGILPERSIQLPHRHNSIALDLILDCQPGCFTLMSNHIDDKGELINPQRADWKPFSAFVTPPFIWHSHHNESGEPAHLIPIQDAGLHNYLRTLDIEFSHKRPAKSPDQQHAMASSNELI
ncbi:MAG TPA: hypothetical protein V6C69_09335 [Trichormus sp.]|jgi:gentisate 1,2-dioxygenase